MNAVSITYHSIVKGLIVHAATSIKEVNYWTTLKYCICYKPTKRNTKEHIISFSKCICENELIWESATHYRLTSLISPEMKKWWPQKIMFHCVFYFICTLFNLIQLIVPFITSMMMMMNCFCGMVDWRKVFSLISSRDHCQRSSPSQISNTPQAGFEPAQNLSSGLVEWSCAVVITTTPPRLKKNYECLVASKKDFHVTQKSLTFNFTMTHLWRHSDLLNEDLTKCWRSNANASANLRCLHKKFWRFTNGHLGERGYLQ